MSRTKPMALRCDALVRRLSRDDKSSIAHALDHLLANKIAEEDCCHSGWYCGNREQFVARHKKAIAFMRTLLSGQNKPVSHGLSEAKDVAL